MKPSLPVLHTPRLTLRPMVAEDTESVCRMIDISRETFSHWFNWTGASTPAAVREYLQQAEQAMAVGTAWHYVLLSGPHNLVGRVGLTEWDMVNGSAELGYMLRTDFEGDGLMGEAAQALLTHAFAAGGLHRVVAYADVENEASRHVLAHLGFKHEGTMRHMLRHPERGWRDHHAYGLLEGELEGEPRG